MAAAFPASPVPAWFGTVAPTTRCGVYYGSSATPSFTLSQAGATSYTVRDYNGTVISSGAVSGTTVTPTPPAGGWAYGWYHLYLDGPNVDSVFGTSYAATTFQVWRTNANFAPNPARGTAGGDSGNFVNLDEVTRGVAVIGPQRWKIDNANTPTGTHVISGPSYTSTVLDGCAIDASYYTNPTYADSNRPRQQICSFPNGTTDKVTILRASDNHPLVDLHWKTEALAGGGSTVAVQVANGSVSGVKITLTQTGGAGTVETFDNVVNTDTAIVTALTASALIIPFNTGATGTAALLASTNLTNAYYAGVKTAVTALYPTVTWFEGPSNEPSVGTQTVHQLRLFYSAVKAGNAAAKVLGPQLVNASTGSVSSWDTFWSLGGGSYLDGVSTHAYNMALGDLNMARANWTAWVASLTRNGKQALPRWQTEQGVFTPVYSVYHPRRGRWQIMQMLVQESFGIPKEQNHMWYDVSIGFWSQPTFWVNSDGSLHPQATLVRVFSEEVFGKNFLQTVTYGSDPHDKWFFAGLWRNPTDDTRCLIVMPASPDPTGSVTFTVTGASGTVTYSDGLGNTGTLSIVGGKLTVPATDLPTYVRLPAAATVTVSQVKDWPTSSSNLLGAYTLTAQPPSPTNSGSYYTNSIYDGRGTCYISGGALPDTTMAWQFQDTQRIDRLVIFCPAPWQSLTALTDFDVQVSTNGSAWTTVATVTVIPSSFAAAADANGNGCTRHTYWDERSVHDVRFTPTLCKYVRLNVRATSNGGEPDATCVTAGGQGGNQAVCVQQITAFCDDAVVTKRVAILH